MWTRPNGACTQNILLFPWQLPQAQGGGARNILGAAFPETGLPALPTATIDLNNLPPEIQQKMKTLPGATQQHVLQNILSKQRQFLNAQSQAPPPPVAPDVGLFAQQLQQQRQQQQGFSMDMAMGMHQRQASGGGQVAPVAPGGPINAEILRAFMNRDPGGMGPSG